MMRIAICAGHGLKAQGGRMVCDPGAVYHGEKEYPACVKIVEMVAYLCEGVEAVRLLVEELDLLLRLREGEGKDQQEGPDQEEGAEHGGLWAAA